MIRRWAMGLAALLVLGVADDATAQYIRVGTPFQTMNDSFYENIGVNFGFNLGPNAFFRNGLGAVPPQFGGHDPNSDAQFGFRAGPFSFNLTAGQGSGRNMSTQIPSVVVPNGYGGTVSDVSQRPFVTGIIPVVGDGSRDRSAMLAGIQNAKRVYEAREAKVSAERQEVEELALRDEKRRQDQTAGRGSVETSEPPLVLNGSSSTSDSPRSLERLSEDDELYTLVNRARRLEAEGKVSVARLYYQQAAREASGLLKSQLRAKILALRP